MLERVRVGVVKCGSSVVCKANSESVLPPPVVGFEEVVESRERASASVQVRVALVEEPGIFPELPKLWIVTQLSLDSGESLSLLFPGKA